MRLASGCQARCSSFEWKSCEGGASLGRPPPPAAPAAASPLLLLPLLGLPAPLPCIAARFELLPLPKLNLCDCTHARTQVCLAFVSLPTLNSAAWHLLTAGTPAFLHVAHD